MAIHRQWQTMKTRYAADPAGFLVVVVLVLVIIAGAIVLMETPKPWEGGAFARLAEGKRPTEKHYVQTYSWIAGAANVVLLTILLVLKRFWWRRCEPVESDRAFATQWPAQTRRVFWGLIFLAMLLACLGAWPRMSHSLWGDEEYTFRRNVHGDWRWTENGELVFEKVDWYKTAYGYRLPNNHLVQTILSRLAHDFWLATAWKPGQLEIDERVVRWPSFVFGLATIPLLGVLLVRLGHARAGPAAALLLAVHPWFIRYISEMRGYAMVIFFVVLLLLCAVEALRTTRWRWWVAFGLCQFFMMWTNVLSLYVPLALNFLIFLGFIVRRRETGWWQGQAARWVVVNILSAMLFFQMMLPNLPWLVEYLSNPQNTPQETTLHWYADMAGYLLGGMDWGQLHADTPAYMNWTKALSQFPINLLGGAALVVLVGGLFMGILVSFRERQKNFALPLVALSLLLAPLLAVIQEMLSDEYFYFWYLIFALPLVPFFVGLGVDDTLNRLARSRLHPRVGMMISTAISLLLVGGFYAMTILPLQIRYPVEPLKSSAEYVRGSLEPSPPHREYVITGGIMMITPVYDPAFHPVQSLEDLQVLMDRARRENLPFYVTVGHYGYAEFVYPEVFAIIEDPAVFKKEKVFHGTWPQLDRHVFRMKNSD